MNAATRRALMRRASNGANGKPCGFNCNTGVASHSQGCIQPYPGGGHGRLTGPQCRRHVGEGCSTIEVSGQSLGAEGGEYKFFDWSVSGRPAFTNGTHNLIHDGSVNKWLITGTRAPPQTAGTGMAPIIDAYWFVKSDANTPENITPRLWMATAYVSNASIGITSYAPYTQMQVHGPDDLVPQDAQGSYTYTRTDSNGYPVYINDHADYYALVHDNGHWLVTQGTGSCTQCAAATLALQSDSKDPTYMPQGVEWEVLVPVPDPSLTTQCKK